jgi:hypothetical protein
VLQRIFAVVLMLVLGPGAAHALQAVTLGRSVVLLTGPWRFHTGDDPAWRTSSLDDSNWESVDLTPVPGAHDSDVGLTNYVSGWAARGHKGYRGFAWYRLKVSAKAPPGEELALVGPADVDSIYQFYLNGHLIGSDGEFSSSPPTVIAIQPHLFLLPRADWVISGDQWSGVIAIQVWCRAAPPPDAGGIHIAPWLGTAEGVAAQYHLQWIEKFDGYIVDATEGTLFLLLAVMALSLIPFARADSFYPWLAVDLVLLAAVRGNQAIYFWGQRETITEYIILRYVLGDPLLLGLWAMAWRACFDLRREQWTAIAALVLSAICMLGQILSLSMLAGFVPHGVALVAGHALAWGRVAFLLLFVWIFIRGVINRGRSDRLALFAMVPVSIGLFATELGEIGVPGIWFPLGVGVSRTEYAYAVLDLVLFAYLLRRMWRYAPRRVQVGDTTRNALVS